MSRLPPLLLLKAIDDPEAKFAIVKTTLRREKEKAWHRLQYGKRTECQKDKKPKLKDANMP